MQDLCHVCSGIPAVRCALPERQAPAGAVASSCSIGNSLPLTPCMRNLCRTGRTAARFLQIFRHMKRIRIRCKTRAAAGRCGDCHGDPRPVVPAPWRSPGRTPTSIRARRRAGCPRAVRRCARTSHGGGGTHGSAAEISGLRASRCRHGAGDDEGDRAASRPKCVATAGAGWRLFVPVRVSVHKHGARGRRAPGARQSFGGRRRDFGGTGRWRASRRLRDRHRRVRRAALRRRPVPAGAPLTPAAARSAAAGEARPAGHPRGPVGRHHRADGRRGPG